MFDFHTYLRERQALVERELERRLPPAAERPAALHEAMRYGVLGGGKRLRPILCLAAAEAVGCGPERVVVPALALELLHDYTLIHDDLPGMDNDDLRRGRPTVHRVFGEANAILAGDALLTLSFEWLAGAALPGDTRSRLISELAEAAGHRGVIAGQVEDIAAEGRSATAESVDYIHRQKTGALIRAAVRMGAIAGEASEDDLAALTDYGEHVGVAFQIADDILNATATAADLGKPVGSDRHRGKATWVAVHGLEASREENRRRVARALSALAGLADRGGTEPLAALARYASERRR